MARILLVSKNVSQVRTPYEGRMMAEIPELVLFGLSNNEAKATIARHSGVEIPTIVVFNHQVRLERSSWSML
jgi:hypothetical protein